MVMVDITDKPEIVRVAKAEGTITLKPGTLRAILEKRVKKGDVLTAAKLAAINAVKKTSDLILLAHPILITGVNVWIEIDEGRADIKVITQVQSQGKTGVELEALLGVMAGLLTIFDMCKYLEKDTQGQYDGTTITNVRVIEKLKNPALKT
jgi:cyclic pyranopterin phosphate synthase